MADKTYLCWETDSKLEPTGEYKILNAPNARWAAAHLKHTLQGSFKFPTSGVLQLYYLMVKNGILRIIDKETNQNQIYVFIFQETQTCGTCRA